MSAGSAHLNHTTHPSSAGEVQHCFATESPLGSTPFLRRPQEGAKEGGNKLNLYFSNPYNWRAILIMDREAGG